MYCKKLLCENYRNIENASVSLSSGVNVFYGDNAQGKTNLLEAIYYFACGKSFRGARDRELISFDREGAYIALDFEDRDRERHHEVRFSRLSRRECFKEAIKTARMSEFVGSFRAVLFSPEHLSIVKDGPAERRLFEDIAISQLYPAYMSSLTRYQKLLSERNALLKEPEMFSFRGMLTVLSEQLAKEASFISEHRRRYTEQLSLITSEIVSEMTEGREKISIEYPCFRTEEEYRELLTSNVEKEIRASGTLYGIHKDDMPISLNGSDTRVYASQGQQRSIALAMKLSEGEISKQVTGEYPVFLLDDILSELDRSRKEYILSGFEGRQVIITCCEEIPELKQAASVFSVKKGECSRISS